MRWFLVAGCLFAVMWAAGCGREESSSQAPEVSDWAKVSDAQKAAAKEAGVPVAFENSIGMRFVLIPAGTFTMGSPGTEEGRDDDEVQHEVVLTKPFYLGVTEVTNAQYRRCKADHDSGTFRDQAPERGRAAGGEGLLGRRDGVRGVGERAGGGADVPVADGGGVGVGVSGGDADEVLVGGLGGGGVEVRERERPEDEGGVRVRRGTGGGRTTATG